MKTTLALTTGMQKMLVAITFGLLSLSAQSTGNHDSVQTVISPAAKVNQVSFTAQLNNNRADLKWTAPAEIKINQFVIEKSTDGINYHDAAIVFAFEDTTMKMDYRYADKLNADQPGVVYYRLCVIAENGNANYSAIVIVDRDGKKTK